MLSDRINKLLDRIDFGKNIINSHRPFPDVVLSRLYHNLTIEWTYNSNAIEGNTLTLKETLLVLEDGLTIGKKSLKEHLEAINHKEAIIFVEELASASHEITERNIKEIHSLILKEIDNDYAGRYRDIQVRISGSSHTPPPTLCLFRNLWNDLP
jgi:Fic family protein